MNAATAFHDSEPAHPMYASPSSGWMTSRTGSGQFQCFRSHKSAVAHAKAALQAKSERSPDASSSIFARAATKVALQELRDLLERQMEETKKRVLAYSATLQRLGELRDTADEEGLPVSRSSETALKAFLSAAAFTRRPYVSLLDNGNLRAFWEDKTSREQVGLQFLGGDVVQYVIFAKREGEAGPYIARSAGRDLVTNIDGQIENNGLRRLMA